MATPRSRLLALPAELRTRIFELFMVSQNLVHIEKPCPDATGDFTCRRIEDYWGLDHRRLRLQPPLTQVSKALRKETLPIYYGQNVFVINFCNERFWTVVGKWVRSLTDSGNRKLVKCFYVYEKDSTLDMDSPRLLKGMRNALWSNGALTSKEYPRRGCWYRVHL